MVVIATELVRSIFAFWLDTSVDTRYNGGR